MGEFLAVMGPAIVASLLLTAIYVYFGIHIVRRGVIFVDLALAQVAAMGGTVAFLLGYPLEGQGAYLFSLAFAFFGAVVFTLARSGEEVVPQEAIIGIVYAFAAAGVTLVGSFFSYRWDLPTGAAIICTFGVTLLSIAAVKKLAIV